MTKTYDWKITAKKAGIVLAEVVVAGLISYFTDNSLFLVLVPVLEAARNYLKHRSK